MTYTIAPAVKAALAQATSLFPKRSTASDGTVGDPAHFARQSWHNPCNRNGDYTPNGVVCAFDLTHDPTHGCDAHRLVRLAVAAGDLRINEAISQGRIWTRARRSEGWRSYGGDNQHNKHAHVSVAWDHRNDTSPWWRPAATPSQEDDMTPEQDARLKNVENILKALVAPRRTDKADRDPNAVDLGDLLTKVEEDQ